MKNKVYILLLILILSGMTAVPCAHAAESKEYQVKAAFVYNFIKFVTWPEETDKKTESDKQVETVKIAIIGKDPFGDKFKPIVKKTVKNKKIELVKHPDFNKIADSNSLDGCQVIFISKSETKNVRKIIKSVESKPILVISEITKFADLNGMIGFVKKDNKIRFEINLDAAKLANLKISSQLLKLALRVIEEKQKPISRKNH
jgi:hypothetical protein